MRLHEITDRWGIYGGPAPKRSKTDGSDSPLTFQGTKAWKSEKDYTKKWFSRPYLTNGPKGNYRLPIKGRE